MRKVKAIKVLRKRDGHGRMLAYSSYSDAGLLGVEEICQFLQVSGAGLADVNGIYECEEYQHNDKPVYKYVGGNDTYYLYYQNLSGGDVYFWVIDAFVMNRPGADPIAYYYNETLLGQWSGGGIPPTVSVVA